MKRYAVIFACIFSMPGLSGCGSPPQEKSSAPAEIVVYSARAEHLIKPVFDAWEKESGVPVRFISDKEGALLARLKAEGANTPADMLITVDAGNLWHAAEEGVLQPVKDAALTAAVPARWRDPADQWFGLTVRARTLVYSTERVDPAELSTYEALADSRWQGRLCLRTSKKVYNQSLVASLIERHGLEETEALVKGFVANLATDVFPNDTSLIEAIAAGQCDVGVVNTYYFGRLLRDRPSLPVALFWANQETSGVHTNVSGAGITRHAPNPEGALALLHWMTQPAAQTLLAELNLEYPVNPAVEPAPLVADWGDFRSDDINVAIFGQRQIEAVQLMDRAGYR